jgi:hypothetical protein
MRARDSTQQYGALFMRFDTEYAASEVSREAQAGEGTLVRLRNFLSTLAVASSPLRFSFLFWIWMRKR